MWEAAADLPLGLCAYCAAEATVTPWDPQERGRVTLDSDGSWVRRQRPHERVCYAVFMVDGYGVCAEHVAEAVANLRDPRHG